MTYSQEGFLASHFQRRESEGERKMTVTSGRKCFGQYGRYDPLGSLVRTLLESYRWYNPAVRLRWKVKPLCLKRLTRKRYSSKNTLSRPSAEILSVRDIPSSRFLFQLAVSERHTRGTGYGSLLPTVQTQGLKVCDKNGKTRFMDVSLLPTPTARSYKNGSKITDGRLRRKISQGWTMELNDLAVSGLLPTPTMRDYQPSVSPTGLVRKNGKRRDDALCNIPVMIGQHCQQNDGKTSQLNPLFVEEMMGYPLMWTTFPFLSQNGDKSQ